MSSIWDNAPRNSQAVYEHLKRLAKQMRVDLRDRIRPLPGSARGANPVDGGELPVDRKSTVDRRGCEPR